MNHYEILYLFPAKYTEEELKPQIEKVLALLYKYGAKLTFNELMGRRKLAYPIKNFYTGYYYVCEFDLEPTNLQKLENELRMTPEILRHQILAKETVGSGVAAELKIETPLPIRTEAPAPRKIETPPAPTVMNIDELDKKLEEILEEKIS
ncbi:MAG: 30S ribosomal protein S6 [Candidatus Buchananbacteria bacterium]